MSGEELTTKKGYLLHQKSTDVAIIAQCEAKRDLCTIFRVDRAEMRWYNSTIHQFKCEK